MHDFLRTWLVPLLIFAAVVASAVVMLCRHPTKPAAERPAVNTVDVSVDQELTSADTGMTQPPAPDNKIQVAPDLTGQPAVDPVAWRMLCGVLEGNGSGTYAALLAKDGRFNSRDGKRYTLFRTKDKLNGTSQNMRVIVFMTVRNHGRVRRILVGLDKPEVLYVDEPRLDTPAVSGGISVSQATDCTAANMQRLSNAAIMLLAEELSENVVRVGPLE